MQEVILIRHGITSWNQQKRIQGQSDIPLADEGVEQCQSWRLPQHYYGAIWYTSTLQRARHTAELMGKSDCQQHSLLMEMDWGNWTGQKIANLRSQLGDAMTENERRGLDFQPEGGESPRKVRDRFKSFLAQTPITDDPLIIVTHKGVIRAAISHATGWDLKQDFGEKLERPVYHRFSRDRDGSFTLAEVNVPLTQAGT